MPVDFPLHLLTGCFQEQQQVLVSVFLLTFFPSFKKKIQIYIYIYIFPALYFMAHTSAGCTLWGYQVCEAAESWLALSC